MAGRVMARVMIIWAAMSLAAIISLSQYILNTSVSGAVKASSVRYAARNALSLKYHPHMLKSAYVCFMISPTKRLASAR
jgi:hypothetical protein